MKRIPFVAATIFSYTVKADPSALWQPYLSRQSIKFDNKTEGSAFCIPQQSLLSKTNVPSGVSSFQNHSQAELYSVRSTPALNYRSEAILRPSGPLNTNRKACSLFGEFSVLCPVRRQHGQICISAKDAPQTGSVNLGAFTRVVRL